MIDSNSKSNYSKYATIALITGLVFVFISWYGMYQGILHHEKRNLLGYLIGLGFWTSIIIGMLFMTLLFYIFKAKWPIIIRRQLEHGLSAFPVLFLLSLPIVCIAKLAPDYAGVVWKWMDPGYVMPTPDGLKVGDDTLYQAKSVFLNVDFFIARTCIYFLLFFVVSYILRTCSFRMDQDGDSKWSSIGIKTSAGTIFFVALATTFLAFDWFKSLEFHWFSTMYGVWFFAASMRAALSVTIIICFFLATKGYLKGIFGRGHLYDLACMMLTFTIFWTYISFSQYFLIYTANIPEETFWYVIREINPITGKFNSWFWVSMGLIFLHFFAPFFMLLRYKNKVTMPNTVFIACWILTFHILDLYWNILPGKKAADNVLGYVVRELNISFYDVTSLIGIGLICMFAFFRSMNKAEAIPIRDPRILASVNHHE
jgi:hypothetical protein